MQTIAACTNPILIVGAPRSGTTLLRSLVDAHSNICGLPVETGLFIHLEHAIGGHLRNRCDDETFPLNRSDLLNWARTCTTNLFSEIARDIKKSRWAEKTPAHVFHMDFIHELFPHALFLHIIRDPRRAIGSLNAMEWAPKKIRWSTRRWIQSVKAGRESGNRIGSKYYLEIRYENLIQNPKAELERICKFVNEPYEEQMIEFHRPENNSWGVEQQPLQSSPINQRPRLGIVERLVVWSLAKPLLRELGYE